MKNLILRIMKYGMRFLYFFMKLFTPVQDKVVFLSRQSDKPSENFRMLAQEFSEYAPHMTSQFYCKLGLKNSMGLGDIAMMLRQMKALAGARVCITESYCVPISILHHKPELKIIQIWHSMVAVKQFGWQTLDMPEGSSSAVANIMQMHEGYDSVVVGSDFMRPFFAEAMRMPLEKILPLGMPVADRIQSERNRNHDDLLADFEKTYPHAVGKKRVVYLPTMRRGEAVDCAELVERFPYKEFALIIKLHPLDRDTEIFNTHVIIDTVFSTEQMITLADVVISDYSGAAAEAALLDKPVYFFTPDIVRYAKRCGLNVDPLTVFPHISFAMAEDLINAIGENRATAEDIALVRKYLCGGCDGHSTEKIVELAMQ